VNELLISVLPLATLVVLFTLPQPPPAWQAFAIAAAIALLSRLCYFNSPPMLLSAAVLAGCLDALTPISIVFGAIAFFIAMERAGAMDILRIWLRQVSPHPVAQIMIVGWAFQFLIEGASGFGTPAALAAPLLVGLGFPALKVAALCLALNSIPVAFGAVGTPLWFGFAPLDLDQASLSSLSLRAAMLLAAAALVIPALALRFVLPWVTIRRNSPFILLSTAACVLPMVASAPLSPEFPSVFGGLFGLITTVLLARAKVGLHQGELSSANLATSPHKTRLLTPQVLLALSPIALTLAVLLVTRLPALGLRHWLTSDEPNLAIPLGDLGLFTASPSLVLRLENIFGENLSWTHALLYVPSILPFLLVAALTLALFQSLSQFASVLHEAAGRTLRPAVALLAALALVRLLMLGGETAATQILGNALAGFAGDTWPNFASVLGALGSFFAGSATISNLTFGGIQQSIALESGLDPISVLALQSAGAAVGNMICIHNIIAVCAVLGLAGSEGKILKMTLIPLLAALLVFALTTPFL
jgi:lactate permease